MAWCEVIDFTAASFNALVSLGTAERIGLVAEPYGGLDTKLL